MPTFSEHRDEVKAMEDSWHKMFDDEEQCGSGNGKAMLLLALRIQQCCRKYFATHLHEQHSEKMKAVDHKVFESHASCARDCLGAGAYRDALKHTHKALKLSHQHRAWKESAVMNVLYYEKEAWKGLGETTKAIAVAEGRANYMAQLPNVPGHDRVAALLEVARGQITQQDFHAAIKTAREALSVDGAPPTLRNISRVKLGVALLGIGHSEEALGELERCDREWTTSVEGTRLKMDTLKGDKEVLDTCLKRLRQLRANETGKSEADVARMRQSLDHNLSMCRQRMRAQELTSGTSEEGQTLHPAMKLVTGGDFENAAVLAEKTADKLLLDICNSSGLALQKRSNLPSCQARAFTLENCFLLNDHRAAVWLEAMQEAVKLCGREPLDDSCPICLQPIAWPAELEVGTHVTVHGLKKATHRNGDQGVVERVSVGSECRVQVRFCKNVAPEGVLTRVERRAVLLGLQQCDKPKYPEKVRQAAEAILSVPEGSLDQDAVDEVIRDVIKRGEHLFSTKEEVIASLQVAITKELARIEDSSTYSLRIRSANLKASKGHVEASRRALITGCMHVYHARCIKRAVDEGQRTCPVCGDDSHFAETLLECAQMPSWDRPSYVD
tara:strand:- start:407 stop:2245 length:1839 start_codon:yes stop_codon:yes gene_type:complete